jgi:hypothetical protein
MPSRHRPPVFSASADMETSVFDLHPIRDGASHPPREVPLLLSLGVTLILIYGLSISLISPTSMQRKSGAIERVHHSRSLLLQDPDRLSLQASARNQYGIRSPGGKDHREGTGTPDPRLVAYTSILSHPSDVIDPRD